MNTNPGRTIQFLFLILLLVVMNGCSLITIERIVEPSPESPTGPLMNDRFVSYEARLARQDAQLQTMATQMSALSTQSASQATQISYLATRGPSRDTSTLNPSSTPPQYIVGSVEIEGGSCCIGGTAGEEIEIEIQFHATGFAAPVTEMRYSFGGYINLEEGFDSLPWEPYVEVITLNHRVFINWVGFYIRVQYRDALGNLSPIYSDDISVEGMPPRTPTSER